MINNDAFYDDAFANLIHKLFYKCFPEMSPYKNHNLTFTNMACKILNHYFPNRIYRNNIMSIITLNNEVIWNASDFDATNFYKILWEFIDKEILKLKLDILTETTND